MRKLFRFSLLCVIVVFAVISSTQCTISPNGTLEIYDIVVYGGTSSGVAAAVQAKRMGKSVVIVCPDKHLGGLTSGGLTWTDSGRKEAVGGISREFYNIIINPMPGFIRNRKNIPVTALMTMRCGYLNHT
jgi:hypothetical protein